MNDDKIYRAHEKIGFPSLNERDQAELLMENGLTILNSLTPKFKANYIPNSVLKKYVTITKEYFRVIYLKYGTFIHDSHKEHLKNVAVETSWVEITDEGKYLYKTSERGVSSLRKETDNYEDMVDYVIDIIFYFRD